ncbi:CapA family protein [Arvimicrobium flavum]|uniref:CapA family protein n=1 Tax=Arvimicrobium flavum TaxID=3393320 RepID=UPI00237B3124|nr:CapA family protein [Mesorhizobium shangrilense]
MTKTVAGIVRGVWSSNEWRYYIEALNYYDEVVYINPRLVTYNLDRSARSVSIVHNGNSLNDLSMLYTFGYAQETLLLAKFLQFVGCPTSDPYHLISRDGLGKVNDLASFVQSGFGTTAHVLPSIEAATTYFQQLGADSYPLLLKPVAGNKGRGIKRVENVQEALAACKTHFTRSKDVLLLEKYMNYRNEYRVYVVDGNPIAAYERRKQEGSVVSNLHQGGSVVAIDDGLKSELLTTVWPGLAKKLKHGVYGVDLAVTDTSSVHVIEVNRTPGFSGLDRLGLVNFPRRVHAVISRRSRKPEPAPVAEPGYESVITILGDINPGDSYWERADVKKRQRSSKRKSAEATAAKFRSILESSDYTVGNLEVSLTDRRDSSLTGIKPYLDRASAEGTIRLLHDLGIKSVSLGNNHTMDFGEAGLMDTIQALKAGGIGFFGAGETRDAATAVVHHHVTVGNLALHLIFAGGFESRRNHQQWGYYAGPATAGVNMWSKASAREQLCALRKEYPDAFIIAFPHWGSNYEYASERQQSLARVFCDCGADLVIGHGSHMMQQITRYGHKWIVYGIGNFVFNSPGRFAGYEVLPFGLIARLTLQLKNERLAPKLYLYPIQSDNRVTSYQPNFVSAQDFERVAKFYMPSNEEGGAIASTVQSGKDNWGYYLSLALSLPGTADRSRHAASFASSGQARAG